MKISFSSTQTKRLKKKTVIYDRITLTITPEVYDPHEDSELLADAARGHAFGDFLDLGCGSGIVGISAWKSGKVKKVFFADVSKKALSCAKENALNNGLKKAEFIQTDLFSSLRRKFDCIAFNPPYLPTSEEEKVQGDLNDAFDGGEDGRKTLDVFLAQFAKHLKPKGVLLLLNSSVSASGELDGNSETRKILEKKGFSVKVAGRKKFFFEELVVFKASKI